MKIGIPNTGEKREFTPHLLPVFTFVFFCAGLKEAIFLFFF